MAPPLEQVSHVWRTEMQEHLENSKVSLEAPTMAKITEIKRCLQRCEYLPDLFNLIYVTIDIHD